MEPRQRKEATSIAGRAYNWFRDKLRITEAPTYTDGYGVERRSEVPFNESAQGQELKRMGETAKNVGELGLIAAGMTNPFTAASTTSALLGTLGTAYGLSLGAQNVYNTSKQFVQDPSSVSNPQLVSAGLDAVPLALGARRIVDKLFGVTKPTIFTNNNQFINTTNNSKNFNSWDFGNLLKGTFGDGIIKAGQRLWWKYYINKISKTPEFNYRVREAIRNGQLYKLMDYGPNSNILVHGDPASTGVRKVGAAIGSSDGKLKSFPHFENGKFVPGKGKSLRFKQGENVRQIDSEDRPIFWGDGVPFYETRTGNMSMLDDEYAHWLATGNPTHRIQNPNDFVLDHPYRYIATKRASALNPVTTRTGVNRNMTEIQSKEVPVDKIWGIEWNPLTQTWGKTIYHVNGTFYKKGGKINEDN